MFKSLLQRRNEIKAKTDGGLLKLSNNTKCSKKKRRITEV